MKYGYARVSTDGQSLGAQVKQLRAAGAEEVFRETASGARGDRARLRRALDQLGKGDVLMVTRLDRLARSTRDLLNTLAAITGKGAGFRSLNDTWADTTTAHGRLMLTVLGGRAEFERELIRARTGEGRERGLLRMVPPTLWMGQISVGFGLVDAVLDVEPTGGRRKPASRYTTGRVDVKGIIAEISNPFPRKKRGRDFVD
jgi:Resolvase, N terminal domain